MYKNSLIVRMCMTENHLYIKSMRILNQTSFQEEAAELLLKKKG